MAVAPPGSTLPVGEPVIYDAAELVDDLAQRGCARRRRPARDGARRPADRGCGAGGGGGRRGQDDTGSGRARWRSQLPRRRGPLGARGDDLDAAPCVPLIAEPLLDAVTGAAGGIAGVPLGDLFALANAIAGIVGAPSRSRTPHAAYSPTRRSATSRSTLPAAARSSAARFPTRGACVRSTARCSRLTGVMTRDGATLRRILAGGLADIDDLNPRSAVAIRRRRARRSARSGSSTTSDRLDEEAEHALAEAARIAVPHVIQARAARDVERRLRAELLLAVLEGRGSGGGGRHAARLLLVGAPSRCSRSSLRTASRASTSSSGSGSSTSWSCTARRRSGRRRPSRSARSSTPFCKLSALDRAAGRCARLTQQVHARGGAARHCARSRAVGPTDRRPPRRRHAHGATRSASWACSARTSAGPHRRRDRRRAQRGRPARADRSSALDHPSLTRGELERSPRARRRAGTDLCGDAARLPRLLRRRLHAAAERISVHPNTFRYRMRRLVELFDLDLDDPEERLVVELQFRLLATDAARGAAEPPGGRSRPTS